MGEREEGSLIEAATTGEDRVRMVARQLSEPRTTNWIAEEADWSHGPTKRVLDRLVDDGVVRRDDGGGHTTYVTDYRRQAIREAMRLRDEYSSVEALTDRLAEMNARVHELEDEYGVESPNTVRASIADEQVDQNEVERRREAAREWEQLRRRIRIARFAVREWEFLSPTDGPREARG